MKHSLKILCTAALFLSSPLPSPIPPHPAQLHGSAGLSFARWSWKADFSRGIRDWLSYPLAQDIGFDPGLYTSDLEGKQCLVREIKSYGQHVLHIGLIKPLSFRVTRGSQFKLNYQLEMGGPIESVDLMLAAKDGKIYRAAMPHEPGTSGVTVRGTLLGVPEAGAEIQAIVIEGTVRSPFLGSSNRLFLRNLEITAERRSEVPLLKPQLAYSAGEEIPVAEQPVEAGASLAIEAQSHEALRISVYDSEGKPVPVAEKRSENPGQAVTYQISLPQTLRPGICRAMVDSGAAQTEFQFLVIGGVSPHPRVLLTQHRIDELRSQYATSPLMTVLRARADELHSALAYDTSAGKNIALLPGVSVFPGLPEYFSLLENYSNSIAYSAVEYKLTGDRAALEAARKGLMTISSWPTWTPGWFGAHGLHTYYEVGVFSQRVAVGYDLIADHLTRAEKEQVMEALWRNSISPTVEDYYSNNRMPIAASNWMANSVGGALAVVVALYGDLPDWNARLGTALAELDVAYDRLLGRLFPGDGSEAEPAGYQEFAMEGISFGMAALHSLGIKPPGTDRVIQSFWWPRYAEVMPDMVLDTGDFGGQLRALSGFAWEAEHFHDPTLRAFYDTAEAGRLPGVSKFQQTGSSLEAAPGLLDLTCCSQPAQPAPLPPPSRIFPERGSAVLRTGWKSTDTVISIRVGPWFNHEHHDQGTFQVGAFGRKLISEGGYANYYTDPNYQTYFMQAPGHNTVLIDDDPFSQPGENGRYWKAFARYPGFTSHLLSPGVDYLSADLADAYGGELKAYKREFIFLKPDILIVRDRLQAPSLHHYDWLLHVPLGAETKLHGENASITVDGACAILTPLGPNNQWTLQKTPLAGDRYTNLDRIRLSQPYEFILGSEKISGTSFLVGMKFEPSGQPLKALAPVRNAGQEGFFDQLSGWTWVSRPMPGPLSTNGVTAQGESVGARRTAGGSQIFGTAISSLNTGKKLVMESSTPVDLSLSSANQKMEISFYTQLETTLKIATPRNPSTVLLDGHQVHTGIQDSAFVLKGIRKGDHTIGILY